MSTFFVEFKKVFQQEQEQEQEQQQQQQNQLTSPKTASAKPRGQKSLYQYANSL